MLAARRAAGADGLNEQASLGWDRDQTRSVNRFL
jgi:hypothetical protein